MINTKISTTVGVAIIILIAGIFGILFFKSQPANAPQENIEAVKLSQNQKSDENKEIVTEDKNIDKDDTDWKEYLPEDNSFSIKYPSNWILAGRSVFNDTEGNKIAELSPEIIISEQKCLSDSNENSSRVTIISQKEIDINGNEGLLSIKKIIKNPGGGIWYSNAYCITENNKVFIMTFYESTADSENKELYDKIISTFEFPNDNDQEIDTSDWKTCRNEKNGYEFKYPNTWRIGAPVNRDIYDCNNQIEKENLYLISSIPGESQKATFSINTNSSSPEEFISQNKSEVNIEKELTIDSNKAIVYTKNDSRGKVYFLTIFKDGTNYTITATQLPSEAIFDALVANFKLLY